MTSLAAIGFALAGCSQFEPFQRQGTWHENDAPMHNIAVELVNPHDLYSGSSHPVLTGTIAETAIGSVMDGAAPSSGTAGAASTTSASSSGGSSGAATSGSGGMGGASTSGSSGTSGGAMQ